MAQFVKLAGRFFNVNLITSFSRGVINDEAVFVFNIPLGNYQIKGPSADLAFEGMVKLLNPVEIPLDVDARVEKYELK